MGKRKGKKGRAAKHAKNSLGNQEPVHLVKAPHSFVINRGRLGKNVNELMINFRKIMEPFTASQLKVQKRNVLKDFVHIAGPLNVTHLVIFTKSEKFIYLRFAKLPRGPTLTFQIKEYSLVRDVISAQKKSLVYEKLFEHHPLLVLNNFSGEGMHFKLMTTMFQNMFPSLNVNKTNLNTVRRCLLLNYNPDDTIDLRQYAIKVIPTGMSKAVKKLIQNKVPDLSNYQDISDFLQKSGNLSESEVEMDTALNTVVLPQSISSRGNIASQKSAIRLYELGPRLKLQLIKIEENLMSGEVMYHKFIKKSPEEIEAIKSKLKAKKLLKEQRKINQKASISSQNTVKIEDEESDNETKQDIEWFRKEVGQDPEDELISHKRKAEDSVGNPVKKFKPTKNESKTMQEFLTRRKKKKQAKLAKKNAKQLSSKIVTSKRKLRKNKTK